MRRPCTGKTLTLRYDDDTAINYQFDEIQKLRWRRVEGLPAGASASSASSRWRA